MSQWGLYDDELDDITLYLLIASYQKRIEYEAKILASEMIKMMGLGAEKATKQSNTSNGQKKVPTSVLLAEMGVRL